MSRFEHKLQPALWSVYANLYRVDPDAALTAMREDGDPSLFDDPFIQIELLIASLLASNFAVRAAEAQEILEKALTPPINRAAVDRAMEEARAIFADSYTPRLDRALRHLVDQAMVRGASVASNVRPEDLPPLELEPLDDALEPKEQEGIPGAALLLGALAIAGIPISRVPLLRNSPLENVPSVLSVHEGIIRAARYSTNNHFNEVILPEIMNRVDRVLAGEAGVPGFNDINQYLSRRLRSVPYWRLVANGAASRAYHYGMMKAGALRQVRGYQLVAVLDERTSEICLELDGQVFDLAPTVEIMERVAMSNDPDEVVRLLPWVRNVDEVAGASTDALRERGYVVPPFHPNCRTTIRFI